MNWQTPMESSAHASRARKAASRKFAQYVPLTGNERTFSRDELIVSKTDLKGRITYANRVFCRLGGMSQRAAIGAPHSIIRHPDMPRAVFKLLWERIEKGGEIFAYVLNMASNGDHYWVLAHVTPTFDQAGLVTGYHSNRRLPERSAIAAITPLYAMLKKVEDDHGDRHKGMDAAVARLQDILKDKGVGYDEFVFSL